MSKNPLNLVNLLGGLIEEGFIQKKICSSSGPEFKLPPSSLHRYDSGVPFA